MYAHAFTAERCPLELQSFLTGTTGRIFTVVTEENKKSLFLLLFLFLLHMYAAGSGGHVIHAVEISFPHMEI